MHFFLFVAPQTSLSYCLKKIFLLNLNNLVNETDYQYQDSPYQDITLDTDTINITCLTLDISKRPQSAPE